LVFLLEDEALLALELLPELLLGAEVELLLLFAEDFFELLEDLLFLLDEEEGDAFWLADCEVAAL
jgi:hypothetical protein